MLSGANQLPVGTLLSATRIFIAELFEFPLVTGTSSRKYAEGELQGWVSCGL